MLFIKLVNMFFGGVFLRSKVAMKLRVTEQHVLDLIEEGKLQAINIGGGGRNFWRIPVEAYKAFLNANPSFRL